MDRDTVLGLLTARAAAYELLALLFAREPDAELLERLVLDGVLEDFPFAPLSPQIEQGAAEMRAFLGEVGDSDGEGGGQANGRQRVEQPQLDQRQIDRLRSDFTRMFIGPGRLVAPPWESAYATEERLLFQPQTLQVRQAYLKYGLLPERFPRESDDHLALELEFMARLCRLAGERAAQEEQAALRSVLLDQKAFLEEHLIPWVPRLAADVYLGARTGFFKGLALVLEGFVELDRAMLGTLLEETTGAGLRES